MIFQRHGVGLALIIGSLALTRPAGAINVLMQHNDTSRTGANTNEYVLNVSNVNSNQFGKLFSRAVDGQIYAQPLYMHWLIISNKTRNVVYVCTQHNSVYAFDADDPAASNALWQVNLGPTAPSSELVCDDITPEVGITSTPTIDPASGTMYVAAKTKEVAGSVTNYFYKLHALDILTGDEKFGGPIVIQGSVSGTGIGNDGTNARVTINDSPSLHLTNAMTLEAWVFPTVPTIGWSDVILKGQNDYYLEATSNPDNVPAAGSSIGSPLFGTTVLATGTWTHLAATYDGSNMVLYVNGTQVVSQAQTGDLPISADALTIGSDPFFTQHFAGLIDEVRIYNRTLSAAEIQTDRDTPVGGGPAPGLVAAYGFNEGTGTTVADDSGNNNTGTVSVARWTAAGKFGNALAFNGTNVFFDAFLHWNRPGLLLSSNVVYVAFAEACKTDLYHGWLFGFNATNLQQTAIFNTTPDGLDGGIWGSGTGPAVDADGNIYVIATNGSFDKDIGGRDYGQSFIKFSTSNGTLEVADWFTPSNQGDLTVQDLDVGASGPVLISTNLIIDVGKDGTMYVVDRNHLGGFVPDPGDTNIVQEFSAIPNAPTCCIGQNLVSWQGPANQYIILWPGNNNVSEFGFDGSQINPTPLVTGNVLQAPRAGGSSLSAKGSTAGTGLFMGITADSDSNGVLYAFDATDVSQVLWNSNQNAPRDALGTYVKFCAPTIVNGKVYAPTTAGNLVVYGLLGTPYEIWQQNNFTSAELSNAAIVANSADPDNDGVPNLVEYAFGLNPKVPSPAGSATLIFETISNVTYRAIQHVQVPFDTDVSYNVEVSDDGTTWDSGPGHTVPVGAPIDNGDGTETVIVRDATPTNSVSQQLIRLRISGPAGIGPNPQTDFIVVANVPVLRVEPASSDFGALPVGQVSTQSFSVINDGADTLSGTATVSGVGFTLLSGSPYNVLGGQTGIVSVTFGAGSTGVFTGSVVFASNGGDSTNQVTGSTAVAPVAGSTGVPTSGPHPLTVSFTDSSVGTITNRFWSFGDGGITNTTSTNVVYQYLTAGTFTVTLIVSGPLGVSTNTKANYIVVTNTNILPQLVVTPGSGSFGTLNIGDVSTQNFSVINTGIDTLSGTATVSGTSFALLSGSPFNVSGGQTSTVAVTFTPASAAAFTGSVVFTSNGGASTNTLTGVATNAVVGAVVASFTFDPSDGAAPLIVSFTDTSTGTITNRLWTFGDGDTSALVNPTHVYTNAGSFTVTLTVRGPGGPSAAAHTIVVTGVAKNSPVGDWQVTVSGTDKGIAFLTFSNNATASGYEIRLKKFGLDMISGAWALDAKGKLSGSFVEQLGGTTNWTGTLVGSTKTDKSLSASIVTNAATKTAFRWKGVPATTFPDLSGTWSGQVLVVKAASNVQYAITANPTNSAVFDVATTATNTVIGQFIATSKDAVAAYITISSNQTTLSGKFKAAKLSMSLKGSDASGHKITLNLIKK